MKNRIFWLGTSDGWTVVGISGSTTRKINGKTFTVSDDTTSAFFRTAEAFEYQVGDSVDAIKSIRDGKIEWSS
jgi:hypothetical protein